MFTAIESYVTAGLIIELILRAAHAGARKFCSVKTNVFDGLVAAVSVASSFLIAEGLETPTELILAEIIVIGRILFRLSRLLAISKSFQRQQQAIHHKLEINLSEVRDSHPPTPRFLPYEETCHSPWDRDEEDGMLWRCTHGSSHPC